MAAGALDPSFGGDGLVATPFNGPSDDYANAAVVQDDGKLLVAGYTVGGDNRPQFLLARFTLGDRHNDKTYGRLDKSFGNGGLAHTSFDFADDVGGFGAHATDIALDADGRIVVAGFFGPNFAAARFNPDGSLDESFADDGVFFFQAHSSGSSFAGAVAVRPDGRIVLGGQARTGDPGQQTFIDATLVQLLEDGSPDDSFGDDGVVQIDLGFGADDRIHDLALQPDGKIVVVGQVDWNENSNALLARFNEDGGLDDSFGNEGKVVWGHASAPDNATALTILSDGRIVAVGTTDGKAAISVFEPDGDLDRDVDDDGRLIVDFPVTTDTAVDVVRGDADSFHVLIVHAQPEQQPTDYSVMRFTAAGQVLDNYGSDGGGVADDEFDRPVHFRGMALAPNDHVLLVGNDPYDDAGEEDVRVALLNRDGEADGFFGDGGLASAGVTAERPANALQVLAQPDGKTLVLGSVIFTGEDRLVLVRYLDNGRLDKSFGSKGRVILDARSYGGSFALDPKGRIIVTAVSSYQTGQDLFVTRLKPSGAPDKSFGDNGTATIADRDVYPNDIELQADGKIVVGGSYGLGMFSSFGLARLEADGDLDDAFGDDGVTSLRFNPNIEHISDLLLQPDGKILAVGASTPFTMPGEIWPTQLAVARFRTTGALDKSFSDDGKVLMDNVGAGLAGRLSKGGKLLIAAADGYLVRLTKKGAPDPKFGDDGRRELDLGDDDATIHNALFADNGGLVVVIRRLDDHFNVTDVQLARFSSTGIRDDSLGDDGIIIDLKYDTTRLAVTPDNKLLLAGQRKGRIAVSRRVMK